MKLTILYGSQTGTAQDIAERMTRQAIQLNLHPELSSMDEYCIDNLEHGQYIVFIVSTTGQGEEPDNMKTLWKYLCRRNCKEIFSGIKYCVLGLGDSSYAKYNFVAKKLDKRLSQLGGQSFVKLALADDQHDLGVDAVIPHWIRTVWKSVLGVEVENVSGVIGPKFRISQVGNDRNKSSNEVVSNGNHEVASISAVKLNRVVSTKRVTSPDHFQDVRFIELDSTDLSYQPGDVLAVQPGNLKENVDLFFSIFPTLSPDQEICLKPQYSWVKMPSYLNKVVKPFSWSNVAEYYLDLQSVPSKSFFEYLNHFADDEMEKWKLAEFCTPEGQDDLYKYCFKAKRSILEVLLDFPRTAAKIPTDYIFDLIPPIKCRSFSIASYASSTVGILVAVVEYKTTIKKPRLGLCSNWLARLNTGDVVPCWVTKGSFSFPKYDEEIPLIMIGPGTGCAPFNSLISQRQTLNTLNELHLFFGCRYHDKDYFFEKEWNAVEKNGKLKLFVAFSRDPDSRLRYVQHQLEDNDSLIYDLLFNKKAVIYVAGNAKRMPIDVQDSITSILKKHAVSDAEAFVKRLVRQGRYQTEVWG